MKPTITRSVVALVIPLVLGIARPLGAAEDSETATETTDGNDEKKSDADGDETAPSESDGGEKKSAEADDDAFGHGGQIGLRVGIVGGYRMILRYDDSPYCTEFDPTKSDQQKFCGHTAPFAITPALSYGIADWLEPFAWGRFGLAPERETDTEPVMMFGAGVRVYTMSDSAFKIFIEPAIGLELEDGQYADYDTDLVLHLAAGPSFDFARYFGAYVTGGVTASVIRALSASLEAELGVQGRY